MSSGRAVAIISGSCTNQMYISHMKSLNVSEFREQCLTLFEQLPAEGIVITKRGRAIAKVIPIRQDHAQLIGSLAGVFEIRGDILSTGEKWDAES